MKQAFLVAGMGFGDEGKGSITDFLTRHHRADLVVRYNGGPQAAHNVVTPEGVHHTFSQFGSGTLAGARTFLSRHMLIDPIALSREADVLREKGVPAPLSRLALDPECVVVTPYHRLANRIREAARGEARHGSVGLGVGEARADELAGHAFRVTDCHDVPKIHELYERKIEELRPLREAAPAFFAQMEATNPAELREHYCWLFGQLLLAPWAKSVSMHPETVIFEGAQGVLLDETHGFAPYNSWTDCTFGNADKLLDQVPDAEVTRIGVLRSYFTRHGPGPFPSEANGDLGLEEPHNGAHPYMGPFRVGYFDAVLARYAIDHCPVDGIALTHLDTQPSHRPHGGHCTNLICEQYDDWDGKYTADSLGKVKPVHRFDSDLIARIGHLLGVPVRIESRGPTARDKRIIPVKERAHV